MYMKFLLLLLLLLLSLWIVFLFLYQKHINNTDNDMNTMGLDYIIQTETIRIERNGKTDIHLRSLNRTGGFLQTNT